MRMLLFFLAAPFMIMDHCLSYLRIYRRMWGGHWEHQLLGDPCHGDVWVRMKPDECWRLTGKHPGGIVRGTPSCEEKGRSASDGAVYCKCRRDLTRAPGVVCAYEGDPKTSAVIGYSCPCGRWPRFLWGLGWEYIGDARDLGHQEGPVIAEPF